MQEKISIIVPVYNTEIYLNKCIESLTSQNYRNLEIVLVNDGSTDSSLEICKLHAKKDDRIIVVNQNNGGIASALSIPKQVEPPFRRMKSTRSDKRDQLVPTDEDRLYRPRIH